MESASAVAARQIAAAPGVEGLDKLVTDLARHH
jgi:hypothetical protein